jgi:hypothetical protein
MPYAGCTLHAAWQVVVDDMTDLHEQLSDFEGHDVIFLCHGTTRGAKRGANPAGTAP